MLVSLLVPNVVVIPISVVVNALSCIIVGAFSSILFDFFYYNYSSDYITKPYRKYYGRFY